MHEKETISVGSIEFSGGETSMPCKTVKVNLSLEQLRAVHLSILS